MRKPGKLTREQRMTPYERMIQEKRMQEKQMIGQARAGQLTGTRKKGHYPDKSREPMASHTDRACQEPVRIKQDTTRSDRREPSGLCCNQAVITVEPAAVNYMPMS